MYYEFSYKQLKKKRISVYIPLKGNDQKKKSRMRYIDSLICDPSLPLLGYWEHIMKLWFALDQCKEGSFLSRQSI